MIKGIGTDIVSMDRIKEANIADRLLNNDEKAILETLNGEAINEFISGRWAAKEAIIKASNKEYSISRISVLNEETGKPYVLIDGEKREDIMVSISHEKDYTIAFSIITKV